MKGLFIFVSKEYIASQSRAVPGSGGPWQGGDPGKGQGVTPGPRPAKSQKFPASGIFQREICPKVRKFKI